MLKKLFVPIILVSTVLTFGLMVFNMGGSGTFIKEIQYTQMGVNLTYYQFNALGYIQNLTSIGNQSLNNLFIPTPEGSFGLDVGHNFALLIQWLTYFGSFFTWPLRLISTVYVNILSLLGLDLTQDPTPFAQWLMSWVYIYQ